MADCRSPKSTQYYSLQSSNEDSDHITKFNKTKTLNLQQDKCVVEAVEENDPLTTLRERFKSPRRDRSVPKSGIKTSVVHLVESREEQPFGEFAASKHYENPAELTLNEKPQKAERLEIIWDQPKSSKPPQLRGKSRDKTPTRTVGIPQERSENSKPVEVSTPKPNNTKDRGRTTTNLKETNSTLNTQMSSIKGVVLTFELGIL